MLLDMIQQSVFDKAGYTPSERLTTQPVYNPFANSTDDLVSEDENTTTRAESRARLSTSRNGTSVNSEDELPSLCGENPGDRVDQVTNKPESWAYC